jgi:membrane protein YdbS with pleckstrin-like domain
MDDQDLLPLDSAYRAVIRIQAALLLLPLLVVAFVLETVSPLPTGLVVGAVLLLKIWLVGIAPSRRFSRWRYALGGDLLRIVHGYLFRQDTVVPLGRVQHIDVHQGPLMRRWDLATLTVHTAGNHGASVSLPGLKHADALAMRETIRAHIKAAQN